MQKTEYDSLLQALMEASRKIGHNPDPPFTAERFMVALIQMLSETPQHPQPQQLAGYLGDSAEVLQKAKNALLEYIHTEGRAVVVDAQYMQHILQEAPTPLTAAELLRRLLRSPSAAIAQALPVPCRKARMSALVSDAKGIRQQLEETVFGQAQAIDTFVTGYFQAGMRSFMEPDSPQPRATFLFAGPSGVGKTFLAEQAAQCLQLPFRRFDMSEYADKEANLEFCGSDRVYKNAKPGNVTGFLAEHPKCVVLFDEVEKAHSNVIHLFLQMLDAGRLRDNYTDETVSFRDAILIFTTNAGRQLYNSAENGTLSQLSRKVILNALEKDVDPRSGIPYFPAALCSRFASGNVVLFHHMDAQALTAIAHSRLRRQQENLQQQTGIRLQLEEAVCDALVFSEGASADARRVKARADSFFSGELFELLRLLDSPRIPGEVGSLQQISVKLDLKDAGPEIHSLFTCRDPLQVLLYSDSNTLAQCQKLLAPLSLHVASAPETAIELLQKRHIDLCLLDLHCDPPGENLHIEDSTGGAAQLLRFLTLQGNQVPVYLLEKPDHPFAREEMISFIRRGIGGTVVLQDDLRIQLQKIFTTLHRQSAMQTLARSNQLLRFATAQTISEDATQAQIRLYSLRLQTAVDGEDQASILCGLPEVDFNQIIGAEDAKKELQYFAQYLQAPQKYRGTGVKAPRGVLLYGPPGTGKTMLAKAMAKAAGVPFLAAQGNQFLQKYVGEGAQAVHNLFRTARKYAPAVLFIDEIDAIAQQRQREAALGGEEILTAFLTEMDGFLTDPEKPVFVLAATNFTLEPGPERSLDPALLRRFDRRIYIDLPNRQERRRFLQEKQKMNPALQLSEQAVEHFSLRSTGMSLAELDSVAELALRSAIRQEKTQVNDTIFHEALETFRGGEATCWDADQLERVARHEAGHAFVCCHCGEVPLYLTVVPRQAYAGYTSSVSPENKVVYTRRELLCRIRGTLGGRAAELVYYGPEEGLSTGAAGDLAAATALANRMVSEFGMDGEFGLATGISCHADAVRTAINRILETELRNAMAVISQNKDRVETLAQALMEKNHLAGPQILQLIGKE